MPSISGFSGNSYNIVVGTKINKTQAGQEITKTLKDLEKISVVNVKAKFDGNEAIKQITTYKDALGNLIKTQQMFEKIGKNWYGSSAEIKQIKEKTVATRDLTKEINVHNTSTGKVVETINNFKNGILQSTTETEKYRNSLGQLVTETTKFDAEGHKMGESVKEIKNDLAITNTTIKKYIDNQGRLVTETKKVNSQKDGTIERIIEEKNAQGQLITTTENYVVAKGREVQSTRQATTVTEEDTTALNANKQALQNDINALGDFVATFGKVLKFQIVTKIITGFTTACREAVEVVKEFDSQLTEFKKVSDLSGKELITYTERLGELGQAVARTRSEMVESATSFRKSGFSDEDSAQLAQLAQLYSNIADEEISAGDSANFIIAQMKAFEIPAENALHIIDALNEVSNNYAVSSADLAHNLGKVSATLHANNVTYEESLGMLTAITELTRNSSIGARGLFL